MCAGMRVLIAITKGEVGGAQEYVSILARGLIEAGNDVGVVVRAPSHLAEAMSDLGATVLPWPSIVGRVAPIGDVRARRELVDAVSRWKPDILHLNSSKAGVLGTGLLSPPNGATIFTCHHAPFGPGRKLTNRLIAWPVERVALPRVDGIITVGLRDMPALRKMAPRVPIRWVRNAVPASPRPASTGPLTPRALWVARLQHPKDPILAVAMWEVVVRSVPDAILTFAGTGPLEHKLRARVARSPARRNIEVLGYVDDLHALRARSSLFVLPTRIEGGLTMATLEAMTDGLVPIVSDAGDARALDEMRAGVCVRAPGPAPFACEVVSILTDPARFETLRANAMRYARDERTPAHFVSETLSFYEDALRGNLSH